jgi:nucleotide-binding universal stress UspA family protein
MHKSSREKRRRWSKRRLAKSVPLKAPVVYEHLCVRGLPAGEILVFPVRVHIDLIVMGSHRRSGLSRLLTGSVAEKVTRESKSLILIINSRAKRNEQLACNSGN